MKFLLDQDVYSLTARFLTDLGHDVLTAFEAGLSKADDSELLRAAREQDRVLVTRGGDVAADAIWGGFPNPPKYPT